MLDTPPSDPDAHAEDFSRRYSHGLEILAGQAMMDLDILKEKMGAEDHQRGSMHHCFFPGEREGSSVSPDGRIMLDSGLMNPDLLAGYDKPTQELWKRTRIGDRAQAIIAHELVVRH